MVIGRNESYGPVEVSLNWQEYDRPRLAIGDGTRVSYATLMPDTAQRLGEELLRAAHAHALWLAGKKGEWVGEKRVQRTAR